MPATDRLYNLLPAIYRQRDAEPDEQGQARFTLRALLRVMEDELQIFEEDLDTLYENWFVETCEEWAVPYLADLLGVQGLYPGTPGVFSQRSFVANTLAYRRRKGTSMVLEQLARDATGWPARVVEFYEHLAGTQNVNHPRLNRAGTVDLRDAGALELTGTAFEAPRIAHTVDVRLITNGVGRYNVPNVGLFLFPTQSYAVRDADARRHDSGLFRFDPLGRDLPVFHIPISETDITQFAGEVNLPVPLRRAPLYAETETLRDPAVRDLPEPVYFQPGRPAFRIVADGVEIPPARVLVTDLGDWTLPEPTRDYAVFENGVDTIVTRPIAVAVDPVLGRMAFPAGVEPAAVRLDYAYGYAADVGGGPYNRRASVLEVLPERIDWQCGVTREPVPATTEELYETLTEAVDQWNTKPAGTNGVIVIMDSASRAENLTGVDKITMPDGSFLLIVAGDWPAVGEIPNIRAGERRVGNVVPAGTRAHLVGDVEVVGTAPGASRAPGRLVLDGLLIEGQVTVLVGNTGGLRLAHCTLANTNSAAAQMGRVFVQSGANADMANQSLFVDLDQSIVRGVECGDVPVRLRVRGGSVLALPAQAAITAPQAAAAIDASTISGTTYVRTIDADNSIFTDTLTAERKQEGCVRFSSLAEGSATPRRFRCQPELALARKAAGEGPHVGLSDALVRELVRPTFVSTDPGHPAFLRLRADAPEEIRTGGEDGNEMGALYPLKQARREGNLRANLGEYLRFGREAGLFFVVPEV